MLRVRPRGSEAKRSVVAGVWCRPSLSPGCLNLSRVLDKDGRVLVLSDGSDRNDLKNPTPLRLMGKTRERVRHDFRQGVERRDAHDCEEGREGGKHISVECRRRSMRPPKDENFAQMFYALGVRPCGTHKAERRSANYPPKGKHALSLGFNKHARKLS